MSGEVLDRAKDEDKMNKQGGTTTSGAGQILAQIKDEEIDWVDLRFTDPKGKWQHLTMASGLIDEDQLTDGRHACDDPRRGPRSRLWASAAERRTRPVASGSGSASPSPTRP